jgi:RND family efflux transporter MFP subunit
MKFRRVWVCFAVVAFSGVFGGASLGRADEASTGSALTVRLVKPEKLEWMESVSANGWLKPWHEARIDAEVGGYRIADVLVDVGSVVTKGQELLHLSQNSALADLRQQEAAVAKAEANLVKAKSDAERARRVTGTGALSEQEINEYLNSEKTAEASLDAENAALKSQKIKLDQTVVRAVDDGVITSRSAALGAVVSSGTELFRLIRQRRVEWQAEVSVRDLPKVKEGLAASVNMPGGQKVDGRVRLVSPTVDSTTGRSIVFVELPIDDRARVGLFASGEILLAATPALTVPETSLVFRDGLNYVFTVDGDHKAVRLRVEVGRRQQDKVEVLGGLPADASVIESGGAFLSDGSRVDVESGSK